MSDTYNMVKEGKMCAYFSALLKWRHSKTNIKENWFQISCALLVITPILM
jgi:hypothetical protein